MGLVVPVLLVVVLCTYNLTLSRAQTTGSFLDNTTDQQFYTKMASAHETSTRASLQTTKATARMSPQPSVSQETFDRLMEIMNVFNLVFEAVSVVMCVLSSCVYALPSMRCATACYLVALNGVDAVSGFLVVVRTLWGESGGTAATVSAEYHYFTIYGSLFTTVSCRRMVYCLSAMVSLERFFVIAFPMKARYIKLVRYPKISTSVMCAAILSIHIYLPLKYRVVPSPKGVGYSMVNSDDFKANEQKYDDVSNAAKYLFSYVPLVICLVLSVALIVALRRHAASRQLLQEGKDDGKAAEARSTERQLALTIWLSTLLYTLLSLPSNTAQVVATYHNTFCFLCLEHRLYTLVGRFSYVTLIASRYTNFFAYLGLSTAFRRSLLRILCPKKVVQKLLVGSGKHGQRSSVATADMSQTAFSTVQSEAD